MLIILFLFLLCLTNFFTNMKKLNSKEFSRKCLYWLPFIDVFHWYFRCTSPSSFCYLITGSLAGMKYFKFHFDTNVFVLPDCINFLIIEKYSFLRCKSDYQHFRTFIQSLTQPQLDFFHDLLINYRYSEKSVNSIFSLVCKDYEKH